MINLYPEWGCSFCSCNSKCNQRFGWSCYKR